MSLLTLLDDDSIHSTAELADVLGTSVEMVRARLERYEQLGLVKKTECSCGSGGCGSCSKCRGCGGEQPTLTVFWERSK